MDPSFDYYEELGVDPSASADEIHNAYRDLAKEFHADAGGGDPERMKRINEAWDILKDDEKHKIYDATRSVRSTAGRRLFPDRLDLGSVPRGESGPPSVVWVRRDGSGDLNLASDDFPDYGGFWSLSFGPPADRSSSHPDDLYWVEITAEVPVDFPVGPCKDEVIFRWDGGEAPLRLSAIALPARSRPAPPPPKSPPPGPIPPARPIPPIRPPIRRPSSTSARNWVIAAVSGILLIVFIAIAAGHHSGAGSQASAGSTSTSAPPGGSGSTSPSSTSPSISPSSLFSNASLTSVSCLTSGFCMAIGGNGGAYLYENGAWSSGSPVGGSIGTVSCASPSFCGAIAAGDGDDAYIYSNGTWTQSQLVGSDGNTANLTSVSCPAQDFCIATGQADAYTYSQGKWSQGVIVLSLTSPYELNSISCVSATSCVAVDTGPDVFTYSNGTWTAGSQTSYDGIGTLSCASPSFCGAIAAGDGDDAYIYSNGTWTQSQLVGSDGNTANLTSVSCPAQDFCIATGQADAYTYSQGKWSQGVIVLSLTSPYELNSISCVSATSCVAVDTGPDVFTYSNGTWTQNS